MSAGSNNADAATVNDPDATAETASVSSDTQESVWVLIKTLAGVRKRPSGFKKVVGGFADWDTFITMPLGYYSGLFTEVDTATQRQCRKFALMCDYVVKYFQLVDCFCTQATIPRDRLKLCTAIALQNQMISLSKVRLPVILPFSGRDEDWPVWKEKTELTFSGLGFDWVVDGEPQPFRV